MCEEQICYRDSCKGCRYNDDLKIEDCTLEWAQNEEINIPKFDRLSKRVA